MSFKKYKIDKQLKENREKVDIDKLEQRIREMLILNGFNMQEVASLLFTVMRNMLAYPSNLEILKDIGLGGELSIDDVLIVQALLVKEFANELDDTQEA